MEVERLENFRGWSIYRGFDPGKVLSAKKDSRFSEYEKFTECMIYYIEDFFRLSPGSLVLDKRGRLKGTLQTLKFLSKKELHVYYICFPGGEEGVKLLQIFECLGTVRFTQCVFSVSRVELRHPRLSFFDCAFTDDYEVNNLKLRKDKAYDDSLYQRCQFFGNVRCGSEEKKETLQIKYPIFSGCHFKGRIVLENVELEGYFIDGDRRYVSELFRLQAKNCIFHSGMYINSQVMEYAFFDSCLFKGKFEFKENVVNRLRVNNCNFLKIADFYSTSLQRFSLRKSIFDTFVGFEECRFSPPLGGRPQSKLSLLRSRVAHFEYVTFLAFASFRGAQFHAGLDLEKINTLEQPNFHRVFVAFEGTKRETFRVIKHALDSHGAHIEANAFFALEMRQRQQELRAQGDWADKVVYKVNLYTSNFGQSYIRPIMLIFVFAGLFYALGKGHQNNTLYKLFPAYSTGIERGSKIANEIATSIIPFKQFLHPGTELISLTFYVIFATLIWQIVVSLKRKIRR